MQIRGRLTLQFVFVVTLIVFFAFGIIYYSSAFYTKNELYQRLENKAITCAEIFVSVEQIDSTMLRIFDRRQKDKLPFENISIYNYKNREIYTNDDSLSFDLDKELLDEVRLSNRKEFKLNNQDVLGITYNDKFNRFVVFAGAVDIFGASKLKNLRNTLILLFFFIVSLSAIAGWIYSGRALKPLSNVMNEVEKMNVDKLDKRLNRNKYNDEIGRLIQTFNTLLDRIENSFKLQKLFISGASHELKNPLTSITSQLQVVLLNDRENKEYKEIIQSILDDIKNLNKTTIDLIEFSRLNYENEIQLTDVRVDDVLWFCKDYFSKTQAHSKVNIQFANLPEDAEKLIIKANEALLKIAFINLTDNACKFSEDKTCNITLHINENDLSLSFSDKGIGLSSEEISFIFEPFYRANSTSEKKGHGLGLALTKKILQLHNAQISVNSSPGKGTEFLLKFERKPL